MITGLSDTGIKTTRLLHIADLHLGHDIMRKQLLDFNSKVVKLCSSRRIDIILIAGDLFDNSRLKDEFIAEIIDILIGFGACVVILPGNQKINFRNLQSIGKDTADRK